MRADVLLIFINRGRIAVAGVGNIRQGAVAAGNDAAVIDGAVINQVCVVRGQGLRLEIVAVQVVGAVIYEELSSVGDIKCPAVFHGQCAVGKQLDLIRKRENAPVRNYDIHIVAEGQFLVGARKVYVPEQEMK